MKTKRTLENPAEEGCDIVKVLDQECKGCSCHSADKRIQKLETTVFCLFGFLFGMVLTHLLLHVIDVL